MEEMIYTALMTICFFSLTLLLYGTPVTGIVYGSILLKKQKSTKLELAILSCSIVWIIILAVKLFVLR